MNIKELIKDNTVSFLEYRKGFLYYTIKYIKLIDNNLSGDIFSGKQTILKFPVPISDVGDATFKSSDKAIYFMRYIKKAIDEGTLVEIN